MDLGKSNTSKCWKRDIFNRISFGIGSCNPWNLQEAMVMLLKKSMHLSEKYEEQNKVTRMKNLSCAIRRLLSHCHFRARNLSKDMCNPSYEEIVAGLLSVILKLEIFIVLHNNERSNQSMRKLIRDFFTYLGHKPFYMWDAILRSSVCRKHSFLNILFQRVHDAVPKRISSPEFYMKYLLMVRLWKKCLQTDEEREKVIFMASSIKLSSKKFSKWIKSLPSEFPLSFPVDINEKELVRRIVCGKMKRHTFHYLTSVLLGAIKLDVSKDDHGDAEMDSILQDSLCVDLGAVSDVVVNPVEERNSDGFLHDVLNNAISNMSQYSFEPSRNVNSTARNHSEECIGSKRSKNNFQVKSSKKWKTGKTNDLVVTSASVFHDMNGKMCSEDATESYSSEEKSENMQKTVRKNGQSRTKRKLRSRLIENKMDGSHNVQDVHKKRKKRVGSEVSDFVPQDIVANGECAIIVSNRESCDREIFINVSGEVISTDNAIKSREAIVQNRTSRAKANTQKVVELMQKKSDANKLESDRGNEKSRNSGSLLSPIIKKCSITTSVGDMSKERRVEVEEMHVECENIHDTMQMLNVRESSDIVQCEKQEASQKASDQQEHFRNYVENTTCPGLVSLVKDLHQDDASCCSQNEGNKLQGNRLHSDDLRSELDNNNDPNFESIEKEHSEKCDLRNMKSGSVTISSPSEIVKRKHKVLHYSHASSLKTSKGSLEESFTAKESNATDKVPVNVELKIANSFTVGCDNYENIRNLSGILSSSEQLVDADGSLISNENVHLQKGTENDVLFSSSFSNYDVNKSANSTKSNSPTAWDVQAKSPQHDYMTGSETSSTQTLLNECQNAESDVCAAHETACDASAPEVAAVHTNNSPTIAQNDKTDFLPNFNLWHFEEAFWKNSENIEKYVTVNLLQKDPGEFKSVSTCTDDILTASLEVADSLKMSEISKRTVKMQKFAFGQKPTVDDWSVMNKFLESIPDQRKRLKITFGEQMADSGESCSRVKQMSFSLESESVSTPRKSYSDTVKEVRERTPSVHLDRNLTKQLELQDMAVTQVEGCSSTYKVVPMLDSTQTTPGKRNYSCKKTLDFGSFSPNRNIRTSIADIEKCSGNVDSGVSSGEQVAKSYVDQSCQTVMSVMDIEKLTPQTRKSSCPKSARSQTVPLSKIASNFERLKLQSPKLNVIDFSSHKNIIAQNGQDDESQKHEQYVPVERSNSRYDLRRIVKTPSKYTEMQLGQYYVY